MCSLVFPLVLPESRSPSRVSPHRSMGGAMAPRDIMTNTHAKSILNSMNSLRKSGTLCDVTLRVQQQDFPAHRVVLAACSDYVCAMFTSEVRRLPGISSPQGKETLDGAAVDGRALLTCLRLSCVH